MYVRGADPSVRSSLRSMGFDKETVERILYNVKCGQTVKEAIVRLGLSTDEDKPKPIEHNKGILLKEELEDGTYLSLGRTDVSMLVCPKSIIKSDSRYVWFTLFGRVFRYRKQTDNLDTCFL